jgi:hypothetical protein
MTKQSKMLLRWTGKKWDKISYVVGYRELENELERIRKASFLQRLKFLVTKRI